MMMTTKTTKTWRSVRLSMVHEKAEWGAVPRKARHSADVAAIYRAIVGADPREHFLAAYLDVRGSLLAVHVVSIGTAVSSMVHPREVMNPALLLGAASFVVVHGHPSGDCAPSAEDRQVTERLREVGTLCGIEMLDHVVVGDGRHYSFASCETIAG